MDPGPSNAMLVFEGICEPSVEMADRAEKQQILEREIEESKTKY